MKSQSTPPAAGQAAEPVKPDNTWASWALTQAYYTGQSQGSPLVEGSKQILGEMIAERFAALHGDLRWIPGREEAACRPPVVYVVVCTGGYWGKGKTLGEAARNSKAGRSETACIHICVNAQEEHVGVDGWGTVNVTNESPAVLFVQGGKTTIGGILAANKNE